MKQFFINSYFFICIGLLSNQCTTPKSNNGIFEIKIQILSTNNKLKAQNDSLCYFPLTAEIQNMTDSSLCFWVMKCSWERNWISKNEKMFLFPKECDSNFPVMITLNPGEKYGVSGALVLKDITIKVNRLGFIFIDKKEIEDPQQFTPLIEMKRNEKVDIFWSNEFYLN